MSTLVTTNLKNPSNPGNNLVLEANGSVLFSAGTATVPSISFTGDLNTGIYSPGADQVAISTGGSGRLFVDASGRVGVGSAPSVGNGIHATINTNNYGTALVLQNANVNGWAAEMQFLGITTTDTQAKIGALATGPGTNSGALAFYTANAGSYLERLRITSAGLVGIGTSSPVAPLHVSGSGVFARLTDTQAYSFGTSGPILDFTGNDSSGASILFARLQGSPSNGNPDRGFLNILTRVNGVNTSTLQVGTGLAADVFVPNGRLGIGITAPGRNLHVAGSSATALIESTGSTNADLLIGDGGVRYYGIRGVAGGGSLQIRNDTANTTLATFTSTGLVGIGTTSPGLTGSNRTAVTINSPTGQLSILEFGVNNALTGYLYSNASQTTLNSNNNPITFDIQGERARIDSSGRLLVGTSSAQSGTRSQYSKFTVQGNNQSTSDGAQVNLASNTNAPSLNAGDTLGQVIFTDNGPGEYGKIACQMDGAGAGTNDYPGRLVFSTTADGASSPTERMRISQNGGTLWRSDGATSTHDLGNSNTSITGEVITVSAYRNTVNDTFKFLTCVRQGFAVALEIRDDGDIYNVNGTYGSLSDAKLKENIVDANSQWDDIKQLRVRNYNFKPETNNSTHKQIGVIAQEIEDVSPGLVNTVPDRDAEGNDLGTVTKSVNYSVLYMKAVKALQEAMERIETLEAKVAALESA
jgi:hypothetical protein